MGDPADPDQDPQGPALSPTMLAIVAVMRTAPHREWTGSDICAQASISAVLARPALSSLHSRRWVQQRWCDSAAPGPAPQRRYWLVGDGLTLATDGGDRS